MCYIFLTANWGVTWMYFSSFVPRPLQFFPTSAEDLTIKARFFQIVLNNYTSCNLFLVYKVETGSWSGEIERQKKMS